MALRASSGLYVLNSAQGTIRVQGRRGPRVVPRHARSASQPDADHQELQDVRPGPARPRLELLLPGRAVSDRRWHDSSTCRPAPTARASTRTPTSGSAPSAASTSAEVLYDPNWSSTHAAEHHPPGGLRPRPDPAEPDAAQDGVHPARPDEVRDRPLPEGPAADHRRLPAHQLRQRRRQLTSPNLGPSGRNAWKVTGSAFIGSGTTGGGSSPRSPTASRAKGAILTEVSSAPAPVARRAERSATTPDCPGEPHASPPPASARPTHGTGSTRAARLDNDGTTTANAVRLFRAGQPHRLRLLPGAPGRSTARGCFPMSIPTETRSTRRTSGVVEHPRA